MSLRSFRLFGFASLALLGLALTAGQSFAEQGWPLNPENRRGGYSSPRYYQRAVPSYPVYAPQVVAPVVASTQIHIQVPAQAKLWFNNQPTTQTGAVREFITSPLIPGQEYSYTVRATWQEGNREIERERVVSFTAGDQVNVDFAMTMVSTSH
jgi:uncharacterized protein (TIGR03000 family)